MKKLFSSPSLSITSALKLLMVKSIAYVGGILTSGLIMRNAPKGYHMYEFREDPDDEWGYIAYIEPHVWCDHSGTFVTRTKIPFGENGNPDVFDIRYGHYY